MGRFGAFGSGLLWWTVRGLLGLLFIGLGLGSDRVVNFLASDGVPLFVARLVLILIGSLWLLYVARPNLAQWWRASPNAGIRLSRTGDVDLERCRISLIAPGSDYGIPIPFFLRTVARWADSDRTPRPFRLGATPKALPVVWRDRRGLCFIHESGKRYPLTGTRLTFEVVAECEAGVTRARLHVDVRHGFPSITVEAGDSGPIMIGSIERAAELRIAKH